MRELESAFLRARSEWDGRFGGLARSRERWRQAALAMALANLALAAALGWLAAQSRVVPYVVEVDRLGQPLAVGPAEALVAPEERLVRAELARYLRDLRTVVADPEAQRELLRRAYDRTRGQALEALNRHFRDENPFRLAQSERRSVQLESLLPLSQATWQAQWREQRPGRPAERLQGLLTVEIDPPKRAEILIDNPLGLYVTEIAWTPLLGSPPDGPMPASTPAPEQPTPAPSEEGSP